MLYRSRFRLSHGGTPQTQEPHTRRREQLSSLSSVWYEFSAPCGAVLQHGIEHDEQVAHPGGEGHLLRFPCGTQAVIEGLNHRIAPRGHQRPHIQDRANVRASSPDGTFPPEGAAIAIEGGHACSRRNLFPR